MPAGLEPPPGQPPSAPSSAPASAARAHSQTARRRGACDMVASAWGMAVCGTSSGGRRSRPCAWILAPCGPRATSCGTAAAAASSPQLRPTLSSDTTADTSLPPPMPPVAACRGSMPPRGRRQLRGEGVQAPLHILHASAWPAAAEGRRRTGSAPHPSGSKRPCFSPSLSSSAVHESLLPFIFWDGHSNPSSSSRIHLPRSGVLTAADFPSFYSECQVVPLCKRSVR